MHHVSLSDLDLAARRAELSRLLRDAVGHGASIGFTLPLAEPEIDAYWTEVAAAVAAGRKRVFAALDAQGGLLGSVQLALEMRSNGRHRAEVQKLLVFHAARGRGIGAALMRRLEEGAREEKRSLLFLDTSVGAAGAEEFYRKLGYTFVGNIPDYAANPDGSLAANAIFYKRL